MDSISQEERASETKGLIRTVIQWCLEILIHPVACGFFWTFEVASNDLRMAGWVYRNDSDRHRGLACGLFYATIGSVKTAVIAMLLSIAVVFLHGVVCIAALFLPFLPAAILRNWFFLEMWRGVMLAFGVGLALTFGVSLAAVAYARWHKLRIWIEYDDTQSIINANLWPPISEREPPASGRANATEAAIWAFFFIPCVVALWYMAQFGVWPAVVSVYTVFGILWWFAWPIVAKTPAECYNEFKCPTISSQPGESDGHGS